MDLYNSLGLGDILSQNANFNINSPNSRMAPPKASSSPATVGSVLGGVAHGFGSLAAAAGHTLLDPIVHLGEETSNMLTGNSNLNNISRSRTSLDQQAQTIQQHYAKMPKTPKNIASFRSSMKLVQQGYEDLSKQSADQTKQYVDPAEYLKNLAATAATPFAFGKLAEGGMAAKSGIEGIGSLKGAAATLAKAPIKNALITQPTATLPVQAGQDIQTGNYGDLAANAGLAAGATLGAKALPKLAGALKNTFVDTSGLFDHINVKGADGSPVSVNQALKEAQQSVANGELSQTKYRTMENALKVSQAQNLENHGSVYRAAKAITDHQEYNGRPTENLTLDQFASDQKTLATAARKTQALGQKSNLFTADGTPVDMSQGNVTVGKAAFSDRAQVLKRLTEGLNTGDVNSAFVQSRKDFPQFFKNKNNSQVVSDAVQTAKSPADLKAAFDKVTGTGELYTKNADGELVRAQHPGGYHSTLASDYVPQFKKANQVSGIDFGHKAPMGFVGNALEKSGLSPLPQERGIHRDFLNSAFAKRIDQIDGLEGQAPRIMTELRKSLEYSKAMTSVQQIPKNGIISNISVRRALKKLGLDESQAGAVRSALDKAHRDIPLSVQGLGGKLTSASLPLTRPILTAQSFGRFIANPAFRLVKVPVKTLFIGAMESPDGKFLGRVDPKLSEYIKTEAGRSLEGNIEGLGGDLPKISDGLVGQMQENVAANLVRGLLEKTGSTLDNLQTNPDLNAQARRLVQVVYGYPEGTFTDSNLAKTLNVVIFPFRFEAKIAGATAHYFMTLHPIARAGLLHGALNLSNWMDSPQGQKWKKDNADFVTMANYFSPTQTLKEVSQLLHGDTHLPDYGEIGGLPFGFIYQIAHGQGAALPSFLESSDQKNPKTGDFYSRNIPQTDKARWYQGLTDLINAMYSFPGQSVGLESKNSVTQAAIGITQLKKPSADQYKNVAPANPGPPAPKSLPSLTRAQVNALTPTRPKVNFPTPPPPKAKAPKKGKRVKAPVPALSPFS